MEIVDANTEFRHSGRESLIEARKFEQSTRILMAGSEGRVGVFTQDGI